MGQQALSVEGAFVISPDIHGDHRGHFVTTFPPAATSSQWGGAFAVAQASHSRSAARVVRGIHYTATPPGCAKLVTCMHGEVLDFVVDLRVGSPTFGRWDQIVLDPEGARVVYCPVGVGHAYLVRREGSVVSYLMSQEYSPSNELGISPTDGDVGLPLPPASELVLSSRDREAPSLRSALQEGLLPSYDEAVRLGRGLAK